MGGIKMTPPKYSDEQRRKAAEDLYDFAWCDEDPEFRPKKVNWVKQFLHNIVPGPRNEKILDLMCELNELHEQNRWIPITERMPEENEAVLFWMASYRERLRSRIRH